MRTLFILSFTLLLSCGIYQTIPSERQEDTDVGATGDLTSADTPEVGSGLPDVDLDAQDLSIDASPDAQTDGGQKGCDPLCGPQERCVGETCLKVNGEQCADDSECIASCLTGTCGAKRGLWVWDFGAAVDPAMRDDLFAFAKAKNIQQIFLESEALIYGTDGDGVNQQTLGVFIAQAGNEGIEVFLLFGYAEWALPQNHGIISQLVMRANTFALGSKPAGIILDVEPHALPEWATEPEKLGTDLVTMFESVMAQNTAGVPLYATVPFWYDTVSISRGDETKMLHEWLLDTVDGLTVMDYRDVAAGPDGLITHTTDELVYAAANDKLIIVNVETQCGILDKTTFCEEGEQAMETELQATLDVIGSNPSLVSVAIHNYTTFQTLLP